MWPACRNLTVHESRVTSVQKRMEPRRSLLGALVDVTELRSVAGSGSDDCAVRRGGNRASRSSEVRPEIGPTGGHRYGTVTPSA